MKLKDVISNLPIYINQETIYVKSSQLIDGDTEVKVMPESEFQSRKTEMAEYGYFLEISLVHDVIDCWRYNTNKEPSIEQSIRAVTYYAENDAYLMPDD